MLPSKTTIFCVVTFLTILSTFPLSQAYQLQTSTNEIDISSKTSDPQLTKSLKLSMPASIPTLKSRDEYLLLNPRVPIPQMHHFHRAQLKRQEPSPIDTSIHMEALNPSDTDETVTSLQRIVRAMTGKEEARDEEDAVRIGNAIIPAHKVTPVGDVDNNGIVDYVVSNPTAKAKRGTVRLYLMDKGDKFLYTRDLIPGQWGFDCKPLQPGERYGHVVQALPVTRGSGEYSLLAVGAPGQREKNSTSSGDMAHVYILKISRKGNVLNNSKVPWHAFQKLTEKYMYRDSALSNEKVWHSSSDDYDDYEESSKFMDAIDGVRNVVFKGKNGVTKASLRVDSGKGKKMLRELDEVVAVNPTARFASFFGPVSWHLRMTRLSQPGADDDDDSDTCLCEKRSVDCFEEVLTAESGQILCKAAKCKQGHKEQYACTNEGIEICKPNKKQSKALVSIGEAIEGLYYCETKLVTRLHSTGLRIEGAKVRVAVSSTQVSDLPTFNQTHCKCSLVTDRTTASTDNLLYVRTDSSTGIICKPSTRDATEGDTYVCDTVGNSYCERFWYEKHVFVNDGDKTDEEGYMFCHMERFKGMRITRVI